MATGRCGGNSETQAPRLLAPPRPALLCSWCFCVVASFGSLLSQQSARRLPLPASPPPLLALANLLLAYACHTRTLNPHRCPDRMEALTHSAAGVSVYHIGSGWGFLRGIGDFVLGGKGGREKFSASDKGTADFPSRSLRQGRDGFHSVPLQSGRRGLWARGRRRVSGKRWKSDAVERSLPIFQAGRDGFHSVPLQSGRREAGSGEWGSGG